MNSFIKFKIDAELKKKFYKKCADMNISASEQLLNYVREWTSDDDDVLADNLAWEAVEMKEWI